MSKKYELPANCHIERVGTTKRDRTFRLIFHSDCGGEDYVSDDYEPEKGERTIKAAFDLCRLYDWDRYPPACKGRLIRNLGEFLDWRGCGDDPYTWARAFYKYTDCGPWVNFLETVRSAGDVEHPEKIAIVRNVRGKAKLANAGDLAPETVSFLGICRSITYEWDVYCGHVEAYVSDESKQNRTGRTLEVISRTSGELRLRVPARVEHVELEYRKVYYEDLRGSATLDPEKCCGVQFGSIVEGSDAEVGPFTFLFPFYANDWRKAEDRMEKETSFYWKRDNATWYSVRTDDCEWTVTNDWGNIEWDGDTPPEPIKSLAEEAIRNDWQPHPTLSGCIIQTIPKMPSAWKAPSTKEWSALPLGDTGAEIHTFENDSTFD